MSTLRSSSGYQLLVGYLAGFGCLISSTLSSSCVQGLQGAIPDFQLSAIRSTMQVLTYIIAGQICVTDLTVRREYVPGLIYYGTVYLFYNVGFFGAATYLPLAEQGGIVAIVCIVSALAHSRLLLQSDIPKSSIIAALVCVVGVVLTSQPAWLFKKIPSESDSTATNFKNASFTHYALNMSTSYGHAVSSRQVLLGYGLGILGGAAQGMTIDINGIILHNVKIIPKATYTFLVCTVGSVAFMFYFEDPVCVIDLTQFMYVLGHSLLSAAASFFGIYAGSIVPGSSLSIVFALEVVLMLASQYTIMHSIKPGHYNWIEVFGCIIIVFGASIPGVIDILAHKAKANELP